MVSIDIDGVLLDAGFEGCVGGVGTFVGFAGMSGKYSPCSPGSGL